MITPPVKTRKKLIEVALPLDAINTASAREKSIRHGHPSTLHLWWARRPLAAARAVIFAQMVDDPSEYVDELLSDSTLISQAQRELEQRRVLWEKRRSAREEAELVGDTTVPEAGSPPTLEECAADLERQRLFTLIEELVQWENTTNERVLDRARAAISKSWRRTCRDNADHPQAAELFDPERLPAFHDPFAGGGALPLEAQRLGLEAHASDLNPVAVLINKAMIEIPPKFAGLPPVNSESRSDKELFTRDWKGAQGLAEDVRFYGKWMRDEAERRIGHLYPKLRITPELARERPDLKKYEGRELTVIAWLWARTVKSPNPAFAHADVPLASTFMLSTKEGKEAYVQPLVENGNYRFKVEIGMPKDPESTKDGTKLGRGANFRCVISGAPISGDYIKSEGTAGRMGSRMLAIVLEGDRERVYLAPTAEMEEIASNARPTWKPEGDVPAKLTGGTCVPYGLTTWGDLFTDRQLVALTTFSDLVIEARERVLRDAVASGLPDDNQGLEVGGEGARAYAEAIQVYLAFSVSKAADRNSALCVWENRMDRLRGTFGRQALPMVWDYAETNPFAGAGGDIYGTTVSLTEVLAKLGSARGSSASQKDASRQNLSNNKLVSTDPPYYDNIGYADLSDYFYVWLRRSLRPLLPELFATLAVPKTEELVASPHRHGSKEEAEQFFLTGMTQAIGRLAEQAHPAFPTSIYYAFKQTETTSSGGISSTGWETFLDAVIKSGFTIVGTWPVRSELATRNIGRGTNALASSIVLVCRPQAKDAPTATRGQFISQLKTELPKALSQLQRGNIAPVDLAQASIGPGMAVYTRFSQVLDAAGNRLSVRDALAVINHMLDEVMAEQEGDFESETRWALAWFEQQAFDEGDYGVADTLSKAKNTSVAGMVQAGLIQTRAGKVRLLRPEELPSEWNPLEDARLTVWEAVHHLIRVLESKGEQGAAELAAQLGPRAELARELAYRLYSICDRKKWAQEARVYNALVQSWPEIQRLSQELRANTSEAVGLFTGV